MTPLARKLVGSAVIVAGLLVAAFFVMLLLIADCGEECARDGERAPVFALISAGIAIAIGGGLAMAGKRARLAIGLPAALAGGCATLAALTFFGLTFRLAAPVTWTLGAGLLGLGIGGFLLRGEA